jgi:hypothetical protein
LAIGSLRASWVVVAAVTAAFASANARAATPAEQRLADRYAPIVALKKQREPCRAGEGFRPVLVDLVLGRDDVSLFRGAGRAYRRLQRAPEVEDLPAVGLDYFLDLPGNPITDRCAYQRWFRRIGATAPSAVYAHVATEKGVPDRLALQYWLYYVYNDFNDKHESDWEMIQLEFDASSVEEALRRRPVEVLYSQHEGAGATAWEGGALEKVGTHPVTFPGAGSHANYFHRGLWLGRDTSADLGCDDATGPSTRVRPQVVVLPTRVDARTPELAWLRFEGRWGQREQGVNNGPTGPGAKPQWARPFTWADSVKRDPGFAVGRSEFLGLDASEVFCSGVTGASDLMDAFYASRPAALGAAALLLALLATAGLATRWRPAPLRPLEQRRSAGQIVRVSLAVYRLDWRTLLLVSGLVFPFAVAAVAVSHVLLGLGRVEDLVDAIGREARLTMHVDVLLTVAIQVAVLALAVAATTLAVYSLRLGGRGVGTRDAYAVIEHRAAPLAGVLLRVAGIPLALTLTVFGIPVAIWYLGRTAVAVPACVIERLGAGDSIRRSTSLVSGNLGRVTLLAGLTAAVGLLAGPLLGAALLIGTGLSPLAANGIGALVGAALMPLVGIVLTLLFLDLRSRRTVAATKA